MSKKNSKPETTPTASQTQTTLPDGFEALPDSEIEGFWNPEDGPVLFTPTGHILCDNGIDSEKTSIIVVGRLERSQVMWNKKEPVECKAGATIGVWYKPGMRRIRQCAGLTVHLEQTGTKDVGKPKPMAVYTVSTPKGKRGAVLPLLDDHRRDSKPQPSKGAAPTGAGDAWESDSEIPF